MEIQEHIELMENKMIFKRKQNIKFTLRGVGKLSRKCKHLAKPIKDISYNEFDRLKHAIPICYCKDNETITFKIRQLRPKREMSTNYSGYKLKKTLEKRSYEILPLSKLIEEISIREKTKHQALRGMKK